MSIFASYWQRELIINKRTDRVSPLNCIFLYVIDKNVSIN